MNKAEAVEITGGLSTPSKMPGKSFGLPAWKCKVGSRLRKIQGSTCSKCYALKGRYVFSHVQKKQEERFEKLWHPMWIEAMVHLIRHGCKRTPYFRWHDAGDLQDVDHLKRIAEVCKQTPDVKHWLPTREYGIVREYLDQGNEIPDNLCIRLSAHMIDSKPPEMGLPTSTVSKTDRPEGSHICPSPTQNNECGTCRACWSTDVKNVDYKLH